MVHVMLFFLNFEIKLIQLCLTLMLGFNYNFAVISWDHIFKIERFHICRFDISFAIISYFITLYAMDYQTNFTFLLWVLHFLRAESSWVTMTILNSLNLLELHWCELSYRIILLEFMIYDNSSCGGTSSSSMVFMMTMLTNFMSMAIFLSTWISSTTHSYLKLIWGFSIIDTWKSRFRLISRSFC